MISFLVILFPILGKLEIVILNASGIPSSLTLLAIILMLVKLKSFSIESIHAVLAMFSIFFLLSFLVNYQSTFNLDGLKFLAHYFIYFAYFFLLTNYVKNFHDEFYKYFFLLVKAVIILGFIQVFIYNIVGIEAPNFISFIIDKDGAYYSDISRASSIFNEPSWYAIFLGFARVIFSNHRNPSNIWIVLIDISIFLTLSISGIIILSVLIFVDLCYQKRVFYLPSAVALGISVFVAFPNLIADFELAIRLLDLLNLNDVGGGSDRLGRTIANFNMWTENPLFGVGPGVSNEIMPLYYDTPWVGKGASGGDNLIAVIGAELGIFALLLFLFFTIYLIAFDNIDSYGFISRLFFMLMMFNVYAYFLSSFFWLILCTLQTSKRIQE